MAFTTSLAGINQTAASSLGAAAESKATLAGDFDDFLTLLTTQLQNQDPTDPMDSSEFTNQLVQFTGLEQQIKVNSNLESLTQVTLLGNIGSAASYLGNEALIEAPFGTHDTSGIKWQYSNSTELESARVQVTDVDGTVFYEFDGELTEGIHNFNWDGKDKDGNLVPPGNYGLKIIAKNIDGDEVESGVAVRERITGVDTTGLEPIFNIGPNLIPQTQILRLFE